MSIKRHVLRNVAPKPVRVGGADRVVRSTSPPKIRTASNGPRVTTKRGAR